MTTYTVTATATTATTNRITVATTDNMFSGMPIVFSGTTFGGITAGDTYYIGTIIIGYPTSTITVNSLPGGGVYVLTTATGTMTGTFNSGGQQIISTVPPGEPLNESFNAVNLNFDQIFAAGPVGSNIQIADNTILTTNTNGNLVLNPNGIGNVIANAHVIPDQTRIRNLGSPSLYWDTVYTQYANISGTISVDGDITANAFIGDGSQLTNIAVGNNGAVQVNWMGALSNQGGTPGDTYSTLQFDSNGMPTLDGTTAYQQRVDYSPYLQVLTPRVESEDFGIVAGPGVTVVGYDDNYNTPRSAYLSVQDQANVTQQWDFGILGNGSNNYSVSDRTSGNVWTFGTDGNITLPSNIASINYANGSPYGGSGGPAGLPLANGTSNINIATANGNVTITANAASTWAFGTNGSTIFPTLTTQRGDNPSGTIQGQTLLFGDATQEAIITTPDGSNADGINSQRLVINPGKGEDSSGGEGGDIYLWAGRGGDNNGSGGDVKIRGGFAPADGTGGYIRIDGGASQANGAPGFIEITGGQGGNTTGGYVSITGGVGGNGTGGAVDIIGGYGIGGPGATVSITGGGSSNGLAEYGNVNIESGASTWSFKNNGTTKFPNDILLAPEGSPITVETTNGNALTRFQAGSDYAQIGLQDNSTGAYQAWTYLETDMANVNTPSAAVILKPGDTGTEVRWTFDAVGKITLPHGASLNDTSGDSVAFGVQAGAYSQGTNAVAVGASAGSQTQGINTVAVGYRTGGNVQGNSAVAIGEDAGYDTQGANAVSIGSAAGFDTQGVNAVAIGLSSGRENQGNVSVAIGNSAGQSSQGQASVAMGFSAGRYTQGNSSVALGEEAGYTGQGQNSIAIGRLAGQSGQGNSAIAMGWTAAQTTQGNAAIAIGEDAGRYYQGEYSIAIGRTAGFNLQANNSIILNATGLHVNAVTANSFIVKPIRNAAAGNVLYYDEFTGEITFDVGGSGGLPLSNGTSNINIATANGNATITANGAYTWTFGTDGNLTLPGNIIAINYADGNRVSGNVTFRDEIVIGTGTSNLISGLYLAPSSSSADANMYLRVRGNINDEPTHIHFDTGNNQYYNQFIGDDNKYIQLANTGNIVINSNDVVGNSAQWTFDTTGNLTVPSGGSIFSIGSNGIGVTANATSGNAYLALGDAASQATLSGNVGVNIVTNGNIIWNFDAAGNLTAPGAISAVGNITGANFRTNGTFQSFGAESIIANGNASVAGNVTAGNVSTGIITLTNGAKIKDTAGNAVAFGSGAGNNTQGINAVAIGYLAGNSTQGNLAVAIGENAGFNTQGITAVAVGSNAGNSTQGQSAVAIGSQAGANAQGIESIAIGSIAGYTNQGNSAVAIGSLAGQSTQGNSAVAIGPSAAAGNQGQNAVAIGLYAGNTSQGNSSVAIGDSAGADNQGANAVAIGAGAGLNTQGNNSIILNATGSTLDQTVANTFTVAPIRNDVANTAEVMFYNTTSKEITYGNTISVSGNVTGGNIVTAGGGGDITLTGGNITGANVITANVISATGNVTASYFIGDGSQLTSITGANVTGTVANATYATTSGSATSATTAATVTGNAQANITSVGTLTSISVAGNVLTGGSVSAAGTITATVFTTPGAGGNISGANTISTVTLSASGNITGGNVSTGVITLTNGATIRDTVGNAVAIGSQAGANTQGSESIAIGDGAGYTNQGNSSIAIGEGAGGSNQGYYAVAIGPLAGYQNQANNSIILNATEGNLDQTTANTFTVAPVRNDVANTGQVVFYNTSSKEVTYGNTISVAGNVTAANFFGNGNTLSNVATQVTGTWTVPVGNSTQSFTVSNIGTYSMWVDCNITNGILAWNATATVTNNNVPVVGAQYAWVYNGGGSPVDFTSIPNQFTGTANTIVRSSTAPSATTNRFDFGINNTSGGNVTVRYGYTKIS